MPVPVSVIQPSFDVLSQTARIRRLCLRIESRRVTSCHFRDHPSCERCSWRYEPLAPHLGPLPASAVTSATIAQPLHRQTRLCELRQVAMFAANPQLS